MFLKPIQNLLTSKENLSAYPLNVHINKTPSLVAETKVNVTTMTKAVISCVQALSAT